MPLIVDMEWLRWMMPRRPEGGTFVIDEGHDLSLKLYAERREFRAALHRNIPSDPHWAERMLKPRTELLLGDVDSYENLIQTIYAACPDNE